jgi:hypothetical protein
LDIPSFHPRQSFFPLRIQLTARRGVRTGLTDTLGEGNNKVKRNGIFVAA